VHRRENGQSGDDHRACNRGGRHDARRTASRRTAYRIRNNLVGRGTPRDRCFRSVTGVRRPACELRGARIKQESKTYFHHSRARGRESSSYADAARGQMDVENAARRPARRGDVSIPLQPTTWRGVDGWQRARVRARARQTRARRRKRAKPPKWPSRRDSKRWPTPSFIITPEKTYAYSAISVDNFLGL